MAAPTTSHIEEIRAQVIAAVAAITPANGYRSTVKSVETRFLDVKAVTDWPTCVVILPEEKMQAVDVNRTGYNSAVSIVVLAYVKPVHLDPMVQDVKRAILSLAVTGAGNPTYPWILDVAKGSGTLNVVRFDLPGTDVTILSFKVGAVILGHTDPF